MTGHQSSQTPQRRALWFHIGIPRTGTTSIQRMLAAHPEALRGAGYRYVTTNPHRSDTNEFMRRLTRVAPPPAAVQRFRDILDDPADATIPHTLISSEMLFNRPIRRLLDLYDGLPEFDKHVVVYLRRQDKFVESLYRQFAKVRVIGSAADFALTFKRTPNYLKLLNNLTDLGFTVVPRLYERDTLVGGDVTADFLHAIGTSPAACGIRIPKKRANASLPLRRLQLQQTALRVGLQAPDQFQLHDIETSSAKPGAESLLTTKERRQILARFDTSNEAVRAKWFADRKTLFATDDLSDDAGNEAVAQGFTPAQIDEIEGYMSWLALQQAS